MEVPLIDYKALSSSTPGEKSEAIRERVLRARKIQRQRFADTPGFSTNASMSARLVKAHCQLDAESSTLLEEAMEKLNFSARAHDRILKVARTLADLEAVKDVRAPHILEAIQYRTLDRNLEF